jgi:hypothetical protein
MRWVGGGLIVMGGVILGLTLAKIQIGLSAGAAALLGALVGAGATFGMTFLQLQQSRKQNILDAKRVSYVEGLAIIRRATVYVHEGLLYPEGFTEEEKMLFFNRMSALSLLAGKEVREAQDKFNKAMPTSLEELKDRAHCLKKHGELLELSRDLRRAMKKELGLDF